MHSESEPGRSRRGSTGKTNLGVTWPDDLTVPSRVVTLRIPSASSSSMLVSAVGGLSVRSGLVLLRRVAVLLLLLLRSIHGQLQLQGVDATRKLTC